LYGGVLMSKLEFLEVTRNFRSYYKTLRDVNYYLSSDFDKEKLQAVSQVITKLIFGFIRMNGTTLREMNPDQYEREYQMFQDDFLNIIQNSGENNVDFDDFADLLDELIEIANHRMNALRKVQKTKQESVRINEDIINQVVANEVEINTDDLINDEIVKMIVESNNVSDEIKEINDVVDEITAEVEEIVDEVEKVSVIVEEASVEVEEETNGELEDVDPDFEEVNESDDMYHFRPRRKRYR
jgi:seryl-tRNA synthetase